MEPLKFLYAKTDGTFVFATAMQEVCFTTDQLIRHRNVLSELINEKQQPVFNMLHDTNHGNVGDPK